jgi:acyl-CoA synthetase (AMP-forming)/AMP-acid ligase II
VTELALLRMGFCILFVSVNNPPAAVAHLLAKVEASVFVVAPRYAELGQEALVALKQQDGGSALTLVPTAPESVYDSAARRDAFEAGIKWPYPLAQEDEVDLGAFIVHSSGSTSWPKPIEMTHRRALANYLTSFNLEGFTTLPLYHNFGHSCLWRAIVSVKALYVFPASTMPLTITNVFGLLSQPVCAGVRAVFAVPFIFKIMSEDDEGIALLRRYELCLYGGSVMPDEVGNRLVENGVKLVGHIGSTGALRILALQRGNVADLERLIFGRDGPADDLIPRLRDGQGVVLLPNERPARR